MHVAHYPATLDANNEKGKFGRGIFSFLLIGAANSGIRIKKLTYRENGNSFKKDGLFYRDNSRTQQTSEPTEITNLKFPLSNIFSQLLSNVQ